MTPKIFAKPITVELVDHYGNDWRVARAAWVSVKDSDTLEEKRTKEARNGVINFMMKNRHGSPFEHCGMTFMVTAPIFVWREHMRHRIASYNEESGRYKVLKPHFYIPSYARTQTGKPGSYTFSPMQHAVSYQLQQSMIHGCGLAYAAYLNKIELGIAKEQARMMLPLNIMSTAYVTINLRSLMNFLSLRSQEQGTFPSYPQKEISLVADEYEYHMKKKFPVTHKAFVENGRVAP